MSSVELVHRLLEKDLHFRIVDLDGVVAIPQLRMQLDRLLIRFFVGPLALENRLHVAAQVDPDVVRFPARKRRRIVVEAHQQVGLFSHVLFRFSVPLLHVDHHEAEHHAVKHPDDAEGKARRIVVFAKPLDRDFFPHPKESREADSKRRSDHQQR
jgi:hypothetical protein